MSKSKNILVLEGGGAKGPLEVGMLETLEKNTGKKTYEIFDMVFTTSIGAVIGSILGTGLYSAAELNEILMKELPNVFKPRNPFSRLLPPIYDINTYRYLYVTYVESRLRKQVKMGDMKNKFAYTTINMCDGLNHFFKSWKPDEAEERMIDSAPRSFAAPYFFGQIEDKKNKSVWLDGGCGPLNLPLWEAFIEANKHNWFNGKNSVHILALGSGRPKLHMGFREATKGGPIRSTARAVKYFTSISEGGLARAQSTMVQVKNMKSLSESMDNFTFQFVDWKGMPEELDKMDNVDARFEYAKKGRELGEKININFLKQGDVL